MVSVSKQVCLLVFYSIGLVILSNVKLTVKHKNHTEKQAVVSLAKQDSQSPLPVGSSVQDARMLEEATTGGDDVAGETEAEENLLSYIMYFMFIYLVGSMVALTLGILASVMSFQPPVSIMWFVIGALMYIIRKNSPNNGLLGAGIENIGRIPSDIIYMVFLPVLLYEGAVATSWHKFVKMLPSSLILAYGGVALTCCVLAGLFYVTFKAVDRISEALLLASSLASTDPVAVISVLKSLKTPEKMTSMFEGESLLNDGTSVAFFQLFRVFVHGTSISAGEIVWLTIRLMFLGPFFGGAWSAAACFVVQHFYGQQVFQTMFLLANMYFTFFVAEHYLGLSGPLSAVAFGLYICARKKVHLEATAIEVHHHVVSTLAAFAESAIFMISGTVALRAADDINFGAAGWLDSFIVYLYMNCARTLLFVLLFPFLRRSIYSVNWRESILLIWGGLRGAIVLSLALTIEDESGQVYTAVFADFATFIICISTVFILSINGTLFQPLYQLLNPYPCELFRRVLLCRVMTHVDEIFEEDIDAFGDLDWIKRICRVDIMPMAKALVPELKGRRPDRYGRISKRVPMLLPATRKLMQTLKAVDDPEAAQAAAVISNDTSLASVHIAPPTGSKVLLPAHRERRNTLANVSRSFVAAYCGSTDYAKVIAEMQAIGEGVSESARPANSSRQQSEESDLRRVISHSDTLQDIKELMTSRQSSNSTSIQSQRAERVVGIQLLVTNALRNKYFEYKASGLISGYALLRLEQSANDTQDNVAAMKRRFAKRHRSLASVESIEGISDFRVLSADDGQLDDAFDVEWKAIKRNLITMNIESSRLYWILKRLPMKVFNLILWRRVERDLQTIVCFVKAHEDLIEESGEELRQLLTGHLMDSYVAQIAHAKEVAAEIEKKYSTIFHEALLRMVAVVFINQKVKILEEIASHGIIGKEDKEFIEEHILSKQKRRLLNYTALDNGFLKRPVAAVFTKAQRWCQ